jgi:hypothetical protein
MSKKFPKTPYQISANLKLTPTKLDNLNFGNLHSRCADVDAGEAGGGGQLVVFAQGVEEICA